MSDKKTTCWWGGLDSNCPEDELLKNGLCAYHNSFGPIWPTGGDWGPASKGRSHDQASYICKPDEISRVFEKALQEKYESKSSHEPLTGCLSERIRESTDRT